MTGGLVIWRAGASAAVYRGMDYVPAPSQAADAELGQAPEGQRAVRAPVGEFLTPGSEHGREGGAWAGENAEEGEGEEEGRTSSGLPLGIPGSTTLAPGAVEDVTVGLGPKWSEWDGRGPYAPVDGDLLLRPGLKLCKPYRMLPYGISPKLTDTDLTDLRKKARKMPPHFAVGGCRCTHSLASEATLSIGPHVNGKTPATRPPDPGG